MLLEKKDFLKMVEQHHQNEIKKMRIKDLRQHFKLTHKIKTIKFNTERTVYAIVSTSKTFTSVTQLK